MPRDYSLYLEDIRDAATKIRDYIGDISFDEFVSKPLLVDAVLHNLAIIGEAAKQIPEEIRHEHPSIEWRKIAGLRDIIALEYFGISTEIVWDILQNKLPGLLVEVQSMLRYKSDNG